MIPFLGGKFPITNSKWRKRSKISGKFPLRALEWSKKRRKLAIVREIPLIFA